MFLLQRILHAIPRYIKALHSYLLSFIKRAQPLVDVETQQKDAEAIFSQQWDAGEIEGWGEKTVKTDLPSGDGVWCSACESSACPSFNVSDGLIRPENVLKANCI